MPRLSVRYALTAALAMGFSPGAAAQQTLFVDPVLGSDGNSGLDPANALETIAQAVANATAGSTVVLRKGDYDTGNQPFPVVVDKPLTIRGEGACGAVLRTDTVAVDNFQVEAPNVVFEDFRIASGQNCIRVTPGESEATSVTVRNMVLRGFRGLNVQQNNATSTDLLGSVLIEDSRIECSNGGVICNINQTTDLPTPSVVVRSTIFDGLLEGECMRLRLFNQATLDVEVEGVVFSGQENGVQIDVIGAQSALDLDIRHATFTNLVSETFGVGAGLFENAANGATSILIENSIFWGIPGGVDLPDYQPGSYTLSTCIVEQPNLLGVGGSFLADPQFARPGVGDYHLTPFSPAIDAAIPASQATVDFDGDPRALDCASGLPDIGADEYVQDYIWFQFEPKIGINNRLRVVGPPGDAFVMAWSNTDIGGVCSYPLPTSFNLAPGGSGIVGADGVGERNIAFPSNPSLVGLEIAWGGAMGNATEIRLMANLHVAPICD